MAPLQVFPNTVVSNLGCVKVVSALGENQDITGVQSCPFLSSLAFAPPQQLPKCETGNPQTESILWLLTEQFAEPCVHGVAKLCN